MKIALVTDGIYPFVIGGMQKHSFYLAKYFLAAGIDVTLIHTAFSSELPAQDAVAEALDWREGMGVLESICLPFPDGGKLPGHYLKSNYFFAVNIHELMKERWKEFDFIYTKGFTGWVLADLKRKGKELPPLGVKFHGYEMYQTQAGWRGKFEAMLLRGPVKFINTHADVVFSYGGKITKIIEDLGVPASRIIEIPTGIAADWLTDRPSPPLAERKFLFIGRYERRKGIEEINRMLPQFEDAQCSFSFIGPIPESKKVKQPNVVYHGKVMETDKIRGLIDQCDVLLTPSYSEGMPNVIMEGMARGLAVIATDVGAVSAQVNHLNGILVEPGNASELHKAVETMLVMPDEELQKMKEASIQKIKNHFTWEIVSNQTITAIRDYLSKK